jgi:hypothetical protein
MNEELRNGINTRLESKNDFDSIRDNFFTKRSNQDQTIINPVNQDDLVNFHNFNKALNKPYEDTYSREYNKFELEDELDKKYESETENIKQKNTIYSKNFNPEFNFQKNVKKNFNDQVQSRLDINNIGSNVISKKENSNIITSKSNSKQKLNEKFPLHKEALISKNPPIIYTRDYE